MRVIPKKNYFILIILVAATIFLTLFLSKIYINKNRKVSDFYSYSNKITVEGFKEYINENQEAIIYISDKYDLKHESFESKFKSNIDNLNLKNKVIFIEQSDIDYDYKNKLKEDYNIDLDLSRYPILIVIIDNKLVSMDYIDDNSNADTIIDYSDFE